MFTARVRDNLIDHNISIVYIDSKDKGAYMEYIDGNLSALLTDPSISIEKKSEYAHSSITNITQSLFENPRAKTISSFKSNIATTMDFIMKEPEAINNLILLTSFDFTTYIHSVNVGIFAIGLAKAMFADEIEKHDMHEISSGFFMHDIGKASIPDEILNKKGKLTYEEWGIMKRHPKMGFDLLLENNSLTEQAKVIALQHHERNDGKGYPRGIKGDEIHMYSKICSIADVFEALTATRPYKKQKSAFESFYIMKNEMRDSFDPHLFQQFIVLFSESNALNK